MLQVGDAVKFPQALGFPGLDPVDVNRTPPLPVGLSCGRGLEVASSHAAPRRAASV